MRSFFEKTGEQTALTKPVLFAGLLTANGKDKN